MLVDQISKDPDHETVILTLGAGEHSVLYDSESPCITVVRCLGRPFLAEMEKEKKRNKQ